MNLVILSLFSPVDTWEAMEDEDTLGFLHFVQGQLLVQERCHQTILRLIGSWRSKKWEFDLNHRNRDNLQQGEKRFCMLNLISRLIDEHCPLNLTLVHQDWRSSQRIVAAFWILFAKNGNIRRFVADVRGIYPCHAPPSTTYPLVKCTIV